MKVSLFMGFGEKGHFGSTSGGLGPGPGQTWKKGQNRSFLKMTIFLVIFGYFGQVGVNGRFRDLASGPELRTWVRLIRIRDWFKFGAVMAKFGDLDNFVHFGHLVILRGRQSLFGKMTCLRKMGGSFLAGGS